MTAAKRCDVLIVGGGIAGASLGCLLAARTNADVVIIEATDRLGGRARSVPFAGSSIDCGLHALLLGKRSSLFAMGRTITSGLSTRPLGASIYRNGQTLKLFGKTPVSLLTAEGFNPISLLMPTVRALRAGSPKSLYRISLDEFCRRFGVQDSARDFLKCLSIGLVVNADYGSVSVGELLAFLALSARRAGMLGYPRGGWNSIWTRFTDILNARAELRLREKLKEIRFDGKKVVACETDKGTYAPKRLVLAIPPQSIERQGLLPAESLDEDTRKRIGGCRMTYGLNVDLLIDGGDVPEDVIFTLDVPTLALAPTKASPELLPPGQHILTVFAPLGTEPISGDDANARADALVELYDQIVRGLKDRIVDRKVSVLPATGAEATVEFNYLDLPPIRCASIENLYMIGDWVKVRGVGGERAFASALKCYRMFRSSAG
ncbi:MAG TPA: NAD(P)/FAD-dependent oxidoreductase [Proteobacteria bacterium]|nr:NAD(P)/FAD-dependent oxidoreductase [Pseudomonadota bacterium]